MIRVPCPRLRGQGTPHGTRPKDEIVPRLPKKFHQVVKLLNYNALAFSLSKTLHFPGLLSPLRGFGNLYVPSFRGFTPPAKYLRSFGARTEEAFILWTYVVDEISSTAGGLLWPCGSYPSTHLLIYSFTFFIFNL